MASRPGVPVHKTFSAINCIEFVRESARTRQDDDSPPLLLVPARRRIFDAFPQRVVLNKPTGASVGYDDPSMGSRDHVQPLALRNFEGSQPSAKRKFFHVEPENDIRKMFLHGRRG